MLVCERSAHRVPQYEQIAVQHGSRVAWQYDKDMWETVTDKLKRKMEVNIKDTFTKVTKEEKATAMEEVVRQKDKAEPHQQGKTSQGRTQAQPQIQYGGSSGSGQPW